MLCPRFPDQWYVFCGYYECWGWGGVSILCPAFSPRLRVCCSWRPLLHSGSGDCDSVILSLAQRPHSPGSCSDVVLSGNNPVNILSPVTNNFFQDANAMNRQEQKLSKNKRRLSFSSYLLGEIVVIGGGKFQNIRNKDFVPNSSVSACSKYQL